MRVIIASGVARHRACVRPERPGHDRQAGPYASEVADAMPRIERAVGLKFKRPPRVEARSRAEVRAFLEQQFTTQSARSVTWRAPRPRTSSSA